MTPALRNESFVSLRALDMRYPGHHAVKGLDLDIAAGEFIALMGPSGCGKSTTLRMIAGLEEPTGGTISIGGRDMAGVPAAERNTPMVWQNLALFPFLSVEDNVAFPLRMQGAPSTTRRLRANEWLERLGLGGMGKRDIAQLSGGQRQRVAIARALVTQPPILLLDEPLSALDAHLRVHLQTELARLHRELKITFVYVTHSQSEAFALADRIVIMADGVIQQAGAPRDVYRAPVNAFVAGFMGMNTLIRGKAGPASNGMTGVATDDGPMSVPATGLANGADTAFVIGADRLRLIPEAAAAPEGQPRVTGHVIGIEFVGSTQTVFIRAASGREYRLQRLEHEAEASILTPGTAVALTWDPRHAWVLPDPR